MFAQREGWPCNLFEYTKKSAKRDIGSFVTCQLCFRTFLRRYSPIGSLFRFHLQYRGHVFPQLVGVYLRSASVYLQDWWKLGSSKNYFRNYHEKLRLGAHILSIKLPLGYRRGKEQMWLFLLLLFFPLVRFLCDY